MICIQYYHLSYIVRHNEIPLHNGRGGVLHGVPGKAGRDNKTAIAGTSRADAAGAVDEVLRGAEVEADAELTKTGDKGEVPCAPAENRALAPRDHS